MQRSNEQKFSALKKFHLPIGQYAITGSGPLGIRNLKKIGDIDLIVTPKLWAHLAAKYGITEANGTKKIVFPGGGIEAFYEDSAALADDQMPAMARRIQEAEIIDGLPFDLMENVLRYKRQMARKKDLNDILLIEQWMRSQTS